MGLSQIAALMCMRFLMVDTGLSVFMSKLACHNEHSLCPPVMLLLDVLVVFRVRYIIHLTDYCPRIQWFSHEVVEASNLAVDTINMHFERFTT